MTMKKSFPNNAFVIKSIGLTTAVVLSLFYAGAGSALSVPDLDPGDPIPGHCAFEDPDFWVTEDGGCKDVNTGVVYSWHAMGVMVQQDAINYCEGLSEAGYDDWKLPSKDILLEAADNGAHGHLNFDTYDMLFWSSSTRGKAAGAIVWLYSSDYSWVGQGSYMYALCARNLPTKKPKNK